MNRILLIAAVGGLLGTGVQAGEGDILSRPYLEFCWGRGNDRVTFFTGWTDPDWLFSGRSDRAAYLYDDASGTARTLPRGSGLAAALTARSCVQERVARELAE